MATSVITKLAELVLIIADLALFSELVHCGVVLKGSDSLNDAGVTSGSTIHCFPKAGKSSSLDEDYKVREPCTLFIRIFLPVLHSLPSGTPFRKN